MVERCPDKTEADGSIPSTLTHIFINLFLNNMGERGPGKKNYAERNERILSTIRRIVDSVIENGRLEQYMEEVEERVNYLKSKYADYNKRAVFHHLIGSTLTPGRTYIEEDFPGDDSVERFVNYLAGKY